MSKPLQRILPTLVHLGPAAYREARSFIRIPFASPGLSCEPIASGEKAIVLIPGSFGSNHYLTGLGTFLSQFGTVRTLSYAPNNMEDGILNLRTVIGNASEVELIGHSQGAMIACHYAYVEKPETRVNQVISLAGRLEPKGWWEWPYRHLIPYLEKIASADKPNLTTLVASHDWLVPYYRGSQTIWGASHLSIIDHGETRKALAKLLQDND